MNIELDFSRIQRAPDILCSPVQTQIDKLTMPNGALDKLLRPYARIMAGAKTWRPYHQGGEKIRFNSIVFAADHEIVTKMTVSNYPQDVTRQMVANFICGGAAQSVLARARGAHLYVVDVGVTRPPDSDAAHLFDTAKDDNVTFIDAHTPSLTGQLSIFARGCKDPRFGSSLGREAFSAAFRSGQAVVQQAILEHAPHVFIFGEMGIGNSTCSAALAEVLTSSNESLAGEGTGISSTQKSEKASVIAQMRKRFESCYQPAAHHLIELLQELGGFEHAALAGALYEAASQKRFVLIDGLIVTSAVAPLLLLSDAIKTWVIASHRSAEPAHGKLLELLDLEPLLDLGMRLGEGSGAALAAGLIQDAQELVCKMATFESANVAGPSTH